MVKGKKVAKRVYMFYDKFNGDWAITNLLEVIDECKKDRDGAYMPKNYEEVCRPQDYLFFKPNKKKVYELTVKEV